MESHSKDREYKGNETGNRGKGKKPHDENITAFNIVQQASGEIPKAHSTEPPKESSRCIVGSTLR